MSDLLHFKEASFSRNVTKTPLPSGVATTLFDRTRKKNLFLPEPWEKVLFEFTEGTFEIVRKNKDVCQNRHLGDFSTSLFNPLRPNSDLSQTSH